MNANQFVVRAGDGMDAGVEATQERLPDALSTNPVARTRTFRAGEGMDARVEATQEQLPDARKARKRGGLSLGLLSLWPHKEKVTRLPQADESSCSAGGSIADMTDEVRCLPSQA